MVKPHTKRGPNHSYRTKHSNYSHRTKHSNHSHKTRKSNHSHSTTNSNNKTNNGWITLKIHGKPYERGFAHGQILSKEIKKVFEIFPFLIEQEINISFNEYNKTCMDIIKPQIIKHFPEFYEELRGISEGAFSNGILCSIDKLIGWNSYLSMSDYINNPSKIKHRKNNAHHSHCSSRCSAFIATGDATEKGDIIMAHNTHCDFVSAQLFNIILHVKPDKGYAFKMQTAPGCIASGMDWFVCSSGMVGCETTISEIKYKPIFGAPYFCRIRQAMQYGASIDDYNKIMLKDNAGDYACSWLFGNIKTNEIGILEIGLKHHYIEKTMNGLFYGMNSAINDELRKTETHDTKIYDLTNSSGSRNYRLNQLLHDKYYGEINIENAKTIISDHFNTIKNEVSPDNLSICRHSELEDSQTHYNFPFGCVDGKVMNSQMGKRLMFEGQFGSACGRIFNAEQYLKKHPEYKKWKPYLVDFPKKPWTVL
jgi:hypothetical protein